MGWVSDDGVHELYLAMVFADGETGGSCSSEGIVVLPESCDERGAGRHPVVRQPDEVVGWRPICMHYDEAAWAGQDWVRAGSDETDDLVARRIAVPDEEVVYLSDREDVAAIMLTEWRLSHREPELLRTEITAAVARAQACQRELADVLQRAEQRLDALRA
jgi:hypothetical protein